MIFMMMFRFQNLRCGRFGRRLIAAIFLLFAGSFIAGCATATWESPYGRGHVLTGRIFDVAAGNLLARNELLSRLARADYVLLGERHDNPDHHRLQAEVVRELIIRGRRPAMGFEMFGLDNAAAIARHLERYPHDAAGLGPAVNWQASGWPDWSLYQPIAAAAMASQLPVLATNLPLSTARRMSRGGASLDPSLRRELGLDRPLPETLVTRMAADIRGAHCGHGSEQSIRAMVGVQRARDAQMAQSLIKGATPDGAILIAGAGHVRKDYGVPIYLQAKTPGRQIISVAFVEIDDGQTDPRKYLQLADDLHAPFDYLWFTPRVDNEDPCEKFKAQLKKMQRSQGHTR